MSVFYSVTVAVVIGGLAVTAIAAIIRIVRGPTILDRMVASDVLLTTLMLAIGADMALRGHTNSIPIMVAIAATAVLATIVVARYVKRQAAFEHDVNAQAKGTEHV
ncbi:MAG: sodium:proton antiporter [Leucobacter sp.]|nr:sodium:proton antiporter [Leucobacter sp.]